MSNPIEINLEAVQKKIDREINNWDKKKILKVARLAQKLTDIVYGDKRRDVV